MNRILKAYEFEPKDNRNFDKITSNILSCVSNLMCDGDYIREMIILSPIINIAIDSTHPERSIVRIKIILGRKKRRLLLFVHCS